MSATIALLLYDLRASGVVRNVLRIATAARDAGLDARLWPVRRQGDLLAAVPPHVPIEPILPDGSGRQRDLDSLLAAPAIARAIDARRPAVFFSGGNQMHVHAALAMRRSRTRRVPKFIGRASNAVASAGPGQWRRTIRPFEHFQYGAMDRIIAVSEELGAALIDTFDLSPDAVRVIPNGVDMAQIDQKAMAEVDHPFLRADGIPTVLAVGRLSRQKNFEGLIRAFALASAARPLRLLILGPGDEGRRERLRRLAARSGVGDAVAVEGFVENPFPYMRHADLFVLSSLWEGASNVLLEALACGCPVVATRAPTGIIEVMGGGTVGPLVPPDDDAALAGAILSRLEQPRDSAALVARARHYALRETLAAYVDALSAATDRG